MLSKILISSLLLSTPISAMAQSGAEASKAIFAAAKAPLLSAVFLSAKTFKINSYDLITDRQVEVEVYYRISFLNAGAKGTDYDFDGSYDLDYEIIIETVEVLSGKVASTDNTFFGKAKGNKSINIFDCESTRNCTNDIGVAKAIFFSKNSQRSLKILNNKNYLGELPAENLIFNEVK